MVYAEPPYDEGLEQVKRFAGGLLQETSRPGFALVTADEGSRLLGAAYGWTMGSARRWSRSDIDAPPEVLAASKTAVME